MASLGDPALTHLSQIEAAVALGRLDGAIPLLSAAASRILAARLLRDTLITALRQEGYGFSDTRFAAWFAGLVPLTDPAVPSVTELRPPRALGIALLAALRHSSWPPLARIALHMHDALLAITDHTPSFTSAAQLIDDGQALLAGCGPSPELFTWLDDLHGALLASPKFAPGERSRVPVRAADLRFALDVLPAPSPRWAIEIHLGEAARSAGWLSQALPLTGLICLNVGHGDEETEGLRRATALRDVARRVDRNLRESCGLAHQLDRLMAQRRRNSRIPALFALLAGFGAMRTSQLEALLGATRLGVRTMLNALDASGVLTRRTIAGVHLYDVISALPGEDAPRASNAPTRAVADIDAALTNLDAVMARIGSGSGDNVPATGG